MYEPVHDIVVAIEHSAGAPAGPDPTPPGYRYLRSQLVARYGPTVASAIGGVEQAAHDSGRARYRLAASLKAANVHQDVELVTLARELVAQPAAGGRSTRPRAATSRARRRLPLFLISIVLMAAMLICVLDRYGDLGFQGNGDLYDILQLGLLPGFIALIPIWLIFHRRDSGRLSQVLYAGLLSAFIAVVGLGYIYQWSWIVHPRPDTGLPPTLWDWLGIALLPFVVPIVTALAGAETPQARSAAALKGSPWRRWMRAALPVSPILVCLVLLSTISIASIVTPPPAHAEPASPPSESQVVSVLSTNQWTFTAVHVTRGQHLGVTAAGTISFEPGGPLVDPNGATDLHPGRCVLPGADHHAALLGRIIGLDLGPPFLIGASYDQIVNEDGMLAFGINDLGVDNNSGAFAAVVHVSS